MKSEAGYLKSPRCEKMKINNTQDLVNITFIYNDIIAPDKVNLKTR